MVIKKDNIQVYVTLPKDVVEKIDKDASENSRTRSKEIFHIVKKHYKGVDKDESFGRN